MPIKNRLNRVIYFWLIFCVLVSLYGYIGDCILNFKNAIQNVGFLVGYFMLHTIFKLYLILPLIVVYFFVFRTHEKSYILKALFLTFMGVFLEYYFRGDEMSLTVGEFRTPKEIAAYALGGLSTLFLDEFYLKKIVRPDFF